MIFKNFLETLIGCARHWVFLLNSLKQLFSILEGDSRLDSPPCPPSSYTWGGEGITVDQAEDSGCFYYSAEP